MFLGPRIPSGDTGAGADAGFDAGVRALADADWRGACATFREVIAKQADSADAWQGLAEAAWWVPDEEAIFEARERAYHLYRDRGDDLNAALMAGWLAMDSFEFRGQDAIANDWILTAHRLLQARHDTLEFGWLMLLHSRLVWMLGDSVGGRRMASRAVSLAKRHKMPDLEAMSVSLEGLTLLSVGDMRRAVRCLDKASALVMTGEVKNLTAEAVTLCQLMAACERIKDYDKARQWCARVKQVSEERTFPALLAVCRPHYASVLMWHGHWQEAEQQLDAADRELLEFMPLMIAEATARLAGLRYRQGDWDEADRLFDKAQDHAMTQLGMAELAAGRGDLESAVDRLERLLRRISPGDRLERAPAVELLVRYLAGQGQFARANGHMQELREIAASVGTDSLRASADFAQGKLASSAGEWETAQRHLEDSVDLFERGRAPFESARARITLAEVLKERGRLDAAAREAEIADGTFRRIGAMKEAERAAAVVARIRTQRDAEAAPSEDGLTAREAEVLTLLADGRSNQEIAADLVLSVRTVERHISNIYQKLGLEGRTARTAAAAHVHSLHRDGSFHHIPRSH